MTEYGDPSDRARYVRVAGWETIAESVLLSTRAVGTGAGCTATLAGLAPDVTATPAVTVATARRAPAASAHVVRLTA